MSDSKRSSKLGKGVSALFSQEVTSSVEKSEANRANFLEVPLSFLEPNDEQPRNNIEDAALDELAESIKEKGVIQPVIVTKVSDNKYMIIEGERRWRASNRVGKKTIPIVVRNANTKQERLELAVLTNAQRQDLNAIDMAIAFKKLADDYNYTHEDISRLVGKNRATITNKIRLLELPMPIQQMIIAGSLSEGHARTLLSLHDMNKAELLATHIINNGLSVRASEQAVKNSNNNKPASTKVSNKEPHIKALEEEMEEFFNTLVTIEDGKKGGIIKIKYNNDDDLNAIINKLRGELC